MVCYYSFRKPLSEEDSRFQNPAVKAAYERAKVLLKESVFSDTHEIGVCVNENIIRFTLDAFGTHKAMNRIKAYSARYYELRERLYYLRVVVTLV